MKASGTFWEYKVVGCCLPILKCSTPPLYHMGIFTPKSWFWYFLSQLKKMRKSSREMIICAQGLGNPP